MVASNRSSSFRKKNSLCSLSLEMGHKGRAMPHGSEANLPEAEAHVQVRDGKDVLCVDDVGAL